jgi:hypothetical protein
MANTILNPSIIAKAAVRILDNELVMANRVYRGYEDEFGKKVNGYDIGDTITIRKPNQFTVRSTITAASPVQDVTEGKLTMTANLVRGVDFQFTSTQLTLNISELAERVIKPAMVQLANAVDAALMAEFYRISTWTGMTATTTADTPIDSFTKFARATEKLDQYACPQDDRSAVISPESNWALAGSQTALFLQSVGQPAYRTGEIGTIGGVATYMSQNVPTFVAGTGADAAAQVDGAAQNVTYLTVKDTESVPGTQTLNVKGFGASVLTIPKGTVFTIAGVFAVNPVTKATLPFLQNFTVLADANSVVTTGLAALTIAPAIITSAVPAFQTVSAAPADSANIVIAGSASTAYRQNMVFHKNAFALAMVPMIKPPGAVDVARETYKGVSVRLIPYYDGANDVSNWRCDCLFAVKTVDPRLAVRLSGQVSPTF